MEVRQENSEVFEDLNRFRKTILEAIEKFNETSTGKKFPLGEIRDKLEREIFELIVVGQFKRGKSYLINALLGEEILPTGVVPLTSIVTFITYGESISASVIFDNGDMQEIDIKSVGEYVTEPMNPGNEKKVKEVWITFPSGYLRGGIRLIDTPGVGSVYRHNTDIAYKYLPRSDAAIFVLSVDQPAGEAELNFLKDVKGFAHKIFFVLNKIDVISEAELELVVDFTKRVLQETMSKEIKVFPLSAKWALEGRKKGFSQLIDASRISQFLNALEEFLIREKGMVLVCSASHRILWYLSEAALFLELERKALLSPLEEFQRKVEIFSKKQSELSGKISYFTSVVDHSLKTSLLKQLDEDLRVFHDNLVKRMRAEVLEKFEANKNSSIEELNEMLKRYITEGLYENYIRWFEMEKELILNRLSNSSEKLKNEIDIEVTELMRFSSELFELPTFSNLLPSHSFSDKGGVFKIKEEPVALELLDSVLTEKIPSWVSHRFARLKAFLERKAKERVLKKWLNQLESMADMYRGRARFAIAKIIQELVETLRKEILEGIDRTIRSLSDAIHRGIDLKEKGELEAKERLNVIEKELVTINTLRTDLGNLYRRISFSA